MAIAQQEQELDLGLDAAREFQFSEADFRSLVALARQRTGISLSDSKRNLVYSRLSRRLRALEMTSFRAYREYLASPEGEGEIESFINSISTNLTRFFREAHHFDHLRDRVAVPFAQAASGRAGQRLRVWSAGCSTGEEPYSIAAVLRRAIPNVEQQDVLLLATDIDTDVLSKAERGEYPAASIDDVPESYRGTIQPKNQPRNQPKNQPRNLPKNPPSSSRAPSDAVVLSDELKSLIRFRHLNLMDPWPMRGLFDAIFCRNVMIYFDGPTKTALIDRFVDQLKPGGWLYIGHSESLLGTHRSLSHAGRTIYRRNP